MNRPKRIIIEESTVINTEKGKVLLEPGAMIEVCESNKQHGIGVLYEFRKSALRRHKSGLYESRPRRRKNLISESRRRKFQKEFRERVLRRIQEQRAPREYKVKVRTSSYSRGD